jgi:aspartokinase-like uncharacterized kinase
MSGLVETLAVHYTLRSSAGIRGDGEVFADAVRGINEMAKDGWGVSHMIACSNIEVLVVYMRVKKEAQS